MPLSFFLQIILEKIKSPEDLRAFVQGIINRAGLLFLVNKFIFKYNSKIKEQLVGFSHAVFSDNSLKLF